MGPKMLDWRSIGGRWTQVGQPACRPVLHLRWHGATWRPLPVLSCRRRHDLEWSPIGDWWRL